MTQAYYPDGRAIPASELSAASAAGQVRFKSADAPVTMRDQFGQVVTVPASEYATYTARGASLVSDAELVAEARADAERERAGSLPEVLKTAGEGVVRGVPLVGGGLYAGLLETGIVDREAAQARATHNPGVLLAGEILSPLPGAALVKVLDKANDAYKALKGGAKVLNAPTALAARGADVVADAASKLGRGDLSRKVLGLGTASAVEAGIAGVNHEIAQAALEDRLTALDGERLWAAFGHSALVGGVAGGSLAALGAASRKGLERVRGKLDNEADAATLRAVGLGRSDLKELYRNAGTKAQTQRAIQRLEADPLFKRAGSVEDSAAYLRAKQSVAGEKLEEIRKELESAGTARGLFSIKPDVQRIVQRVREEILTPAKSGKAADAVAAELDAGTLKRLERKFVEPLEKHADNANYSDVHTIRRLLDDEAKFDAARPNRNVTPFREARRIFEEEYESAVKSAAQNGDIPENLHAAYLDAKREYGDFTILADRVNARAIDAQAKDPIRWGDKVTAGLGVAGALVSGDPTSLEGLATGAGVAIASRAVSRYQNPVIASVARALSRYSSAREEAARFVATGRVGAKAAEIVARKERERAEDADERYQRVVARVLANNVEPARLIERVAANAGMIADTNPVAYQGLVTSALRAQAYLTSALPAPVTRRSASLTPSAEAAPKVSRIAQKRLLDTADAIENPIGVVEEIARGELNRTKIATLKATAPQVYADVRADVAHALATSEEPLPYKRRVFLGSVFELPSDKSLRPADFAAIQGALAPVPASETPADSGARLPGNAADALRETADSMTTNSDSLGA